MAPELIRIQEDKFYGHMVKTKGAVAFFGTRHADENFCRRFGSLHFTKQVHGNKIINAGGGGEADGQWVMVPGEAAAVATADCVPIIILSGKIVVSLHAGWKGIEKGIIQAGVDICLNKAPTSKCIVCIGPHIASQSFEVGIDVGERLQAISARTVSLPHSNPKKVYISLEKIVREILGRKGFDRRQVVSVAADTMTNTDYYSYRRDGGTGSRLISLGVLT